MSVIPFEVLLFDGKIWRATSIVKNHNLSKLLCLDGSKILQLLLFKRECESPHRLVGSSRPSLPPNIFLKQDEADSWYFIRFQGKKIFQHRPQIAWKSISDFLQFVSSRFTRYIFFHKYISDQKTNRQKYRYPYNQTEKETYKRTILRTPTRTRIRWHLQWHPLWQPPLRSANPDPYTHQMTASMTPCVTTARSWICKPTPIHTSDYTSNNTLCDSPLLDLRTLTPTHTRRHLQRHPVWQPPPTTHPQNPRTLTPQLEVRTPIAKDMWGINGTT